VFAVVVDDDDDDDVVEGWMHTRSLKSESP